VHDTWSPDQYDKFAAERRRPFVDLLELVDPVPAGRVVDLGCGTGALTVQLHRATGAATTLGVDSSAAMLEKAEPLAGDGARFELGDIEEWSAAGTERPDVIFANASLQWVADPPGLLGRLVRSLAPRGQLAFQVPANQDHPSHVLTPYRAALDPAAYDRFVSEYRTRLVAELGPARPYFYAFKRILARARMAD
jgi:trans-aconitate 2-methyltransferase